MNSECADSVVRSLHRWRSKAERGTKSGTTALAPGFGVFYRRIETQIELMKKEAETLPRVKRLLTPLAERAALLREVLDQRLDALEAVDDHRAGEALDPIFHRLASIDPFFEPRSLLEADRDQLLLLIQRLSHVQREIHLSIPGSSYFDFT